MIHWKLLQEIEIWLYEQVVYAESVLNNGTHKFLWDFEVQTDNLIPARRPDLAIVNNKNKIDK